MLEAVFAQKCARVPKDVSVDEDEMAGGKARFYIP